MDWLKAHARFLVWGTVALLVAAVLVREQSARPSATADIVEPALRAPVARQDSAPPRTELDLARLAARNKTTPERDLFGKRDWSPPAPKVARAPDPVPPEEPLPPVPYTYLGRWVEPKGVVVMLGREGRSYLARAGDVLEGTWRVDAIDATQIGLTYLPRNAPLTLAIAPGATAAQGSALAVRADATNADAVLQITMPETAAIGDDVLVLVRLDPRKVVAIERASVELRYDPAVLSAVANAAGRAAAPGRIALDLSGGYIGHAGPSSVVRLRVIAAGATTTRITLADAQASDVESRGIAVGIDGPNPRVIAIAGPKK